MRQKRAKAYKRLMSLYSQTFGFRQPFQVLVAHDFLLELANKQLDVSKQLSNCVQGECKPMITQCSVELLYALGKEYQHVVDIAKTFERRRCNHREALPEHDCIVEVVGGTNKHRYTMAIQSTKLRNHLRRIPGIPIIHFNERSVMVLEMPSEATLKHKEDAERANLTSQLSTHPIPSASNIITSNSSSSGIAGPSDPTVRSRKAGPKAPNPLSISRKKADMKQTGRLSKKDLAEIEEREERKRARLAEKAKAREHDDESEEEDRRNDDEFEASDGEQRERTSGQKRKRQSAQDESDADGSEEDTAPTSSAPQKIVNTVNDTVEGATSESAGNGERKKRVRKRKRKAGAAPSGEVDQDEGDEVQE